eukprot:7670912-Lingulodinium_polyedra.AAC.1
MASSAPESSEPISTRLIKEFSCVSHTTSRSELRRLQQLCEATKHCMREFARQLVSDAAGSPVL